MSGEYRDGTVGELKPGDGFAFGSEMAETPHFEVGDRDLCRSVLLNGRWGEIASAPSVKIRIWPAYFKNKEAFQKLLAGQEAWVKVILHNTEPDEDGEVMVSMPTPVGSAAGPDIFVPLTEVFTTPPQPDFDLEAFRAKVEELRQEALDEELDVTEGYLGSVLDLLPPKPEPDPEAVAIEALTHHYVYEGQDPSELKKFAQVRGPYVVEALRGAGLLREGV